MSLSVSAYFVMLFFVEIDQTLGRGEIWHLTHPDPAIRSPGMARPGRHGSMAPRSGSSDSRRQLPEHTLPFRHRNRFWGNRRKPKKSHDIWGLRNDIGMINRVSLQTLRLPEWQNLFGRCWNCPELSSLESLFKHINRVTIAINFPQLLMMVSADHSMWYMPHLGGPSNAVVRCSLCIQNLAC